MKTELHPTPRITPAQVVEKVIASCEARFPGVTLHFREMQTSCHLYAEGPKGSRNMTANKPMRAASIEHLCRVVSEDNLGGAA